MRQLPEIQKQALTLIDKAQKILCITSEKSSGDGVMAVLATQQWLSGKGKDVKAVFPGQIPAHFAFLSGLEALESDFSRQGNLVISVAGAGKDKALDYTVGEDGAMNIVLPADKKDVVMRQEAEKYDLIICFEVADLNDLGDIYTEQIDFFQNTPLINIAANGHNEFYAKLNLVDPTKSSVSEIVYGLIDKEPTADLATVLLTGVIAGSESFLGENTTASAFAVASKLQALGADQSDIIENLYKKKSLKTLKLWGQIFSRLEFDQTHGICRSTLHRSDFEMVDATPTEVENLTKDILRFVDGSDVFVLCYEYDGQIGVQLRTSDASFDWKSVLGEQAFKSAPGGVDIQFSDGHLADVEKSIFTALVDYQIRTKHIDPDENASFRDCFPADFSEDIVSDLVPEDTIVPQAPANIPFEAPIQPHESTGEMPSGETKKDWIKKNFPKN